jgi:UDP-N-acetylmuramoyl-L-alanyl-D-glutamate--2,6-diaminopimelate ligase
VKLSKLLKTVTVKNIFKPAVFDTDRAEAKNLRVTSAKPVSPEIDCDIRSIHCRAQDVQPGGLFVAIAGYKADGHDFIDTALKRGASAIVVQKPVAKDGVIVEVENTRAAMAQIAANFYQNPSESLFLIGITGTNGKTTVSYLIEHILRTAKCEVGVIGTVNYRYLDQAFDNPSTTPESIDLQRILAEMKSRGVTHVVMEVSSHGIDLNRIDQCFFNIALFTNLSHDHLDHHGNLQNYWACKQKLFTQYLICGPKKKQAVAVINCDDLNGKTLAGSLSIPVVSVGQADDNMIRPAKLHFTLDGLAGEVYTPVGAFPVQSTLVGKHNLENILCATGVGVAMGLPVEKIKAGIEDVHRIPGRLEPVANNSGRFIYVDYAHTPDALENVLTALKTLAPRKMICVFGCGGDRDKSKRPHMGESVGKHCDLAIITSDNPRSETPLRIIQDIVPGIKKQAGYQYHVLDPAKGILRKGFMIEPDRKTAIFEAIKICRPGDIVLIAGKGHETYQIIGDTTIAFDDRCIARAALEE